MMSTLEKLLDDTEAQLAGAATALEAGDLIDLSDLPPRIEQICRLAVESRQKGAAERLIALHQRLDALEKQLKARLALISDQPDREGDPKRVSEKYRTAAAQTAPAEDK